MNRPDARFFRTHRLFRPHRKPIERRSGVTLGSALSPESSQIARWIGLESGVRCVLRCAVDVLWRGDGNVARLARMLRDAGFAFLIHAGEDGQTDWRVQARIMSS